VRIKILDSFLASIGLIVTRYGCPGPRLDYHCARGNGDLYTAAPIQL